jgi:choline dehydrogenase-like flavoprotein
VAIVGAGVAGALLAWRLATSGVRVVMLEAGPRVDRAQAVNQFRAALVKSPESAYPNVEWAPHPVVVDLDHYYVHSGPEKFRSTYERMVGGTTWHWLGSMIRLLPSDFAMRSRFGVGMDWPISYAALEPWYVEAEKEIGVAGDDNFDLGAPRSTGYPLPSIPPTYGDKIIGGAAAALGLTVEPTPQARNSEPFQGRPQCCGNASCIPICPIQAKYDATVHVMLAERAGARLIENGVASRIDIDSLGNVTGIHYKAPDNTEYELTARYYVVAANAIETAKLLLISTTSSLPTGVANSSDQVGRNLADHPTQLSIALAHEPLYPYRSPLATAGIEQLRDGPFRRERGAFRVEIGNDGWSWPGFDPPGLAESLIRTGTNGESLFRAVGEQTARQARLASLCEQLPNPDRRIVPDECQVDALGIPRPRLSYHLDDYTLAGLDAARQLHEKLFNALGVSDRRHILQFQGAGHIMGTHRMGNDPNTSVTNADGRTHDHPNLFLAGAGLFPTTGTANPTLTIAALALRTAAVILTDLRAGGTPIALPTDSVPAVGAASTYASA